LFSYNNVRIRPADCENHRTTYLKQVWPIFYCSGLDAKIRPLVGPLTDRYYRPLDSRFGGVLAHNMIATE
jgi:hypothetical protein